MAAAITPPSKVIVMQIDSSGNISFDHSMVMFKTKEKPQMLRIDTSQLHQRYPDSSIVRLKVDLKEVKHIKAVFVEDGINPWMQKVAFNEPLQGRIDSILILFKMPTEYGNNTGPFPFYLVIDGTGAKSVLAAEYDPQVGNEPPIT
jgi:hypothetical protein